MNTHSEIAEHYKDCTLYIALPAAFISLGEEEEVPKRDEPQTLVTEKGTPSQHSVEQEACIGKPKRFCVKSMLGEMLGGQERYG